MATVITIQPSSTAVPTSHSPSLHRRHPSNSNSTPNILSPSPISIHSSLPRLGSRDAASCDACLRRKSRCAMNDLVNKCYSCDFHRQECTFTLSTEAPIKKRKLEDSPRELESVKRYVQSEKREDAMESELNIFIQDPLYNPTHIPRPNLQPPRPYASIKAP